MIVPYAGNGSSGPPCARRPIPKTTIRVTSVTPSPQRRQRPGSAVRQQPVMAGEPVTQAVINAGIPGTGALRNWETPCSARPWLRYPQPRRQAEAPARSGSRSCRRDGGNPLNCAGSSNSIWRASPGKPRAPRRPRAKPCGSFWTRFSPQFARRFGRSATGIRCVPGDGRVKGCRPKPGLRIGIEDDIVDQGGVYALWGRLAVGKTTTTAKLAARCVLRHGANKVALVTTDGYRSAPMSNCASTAEFSAFPCIW